MLKIISSRSWSYFFAIAWALSLAACGGGGSGSSTTATTGTTTTPVAASPTLVLTGSVTAISATTAATLTATLKSGTGTVLPGVVVTFKTTGTTFGAFVPVSGTALTDANGNATISLAAGVQSGADSVTATATVSGATITSNVFGYNSTGTTTGSTVALVSLSASPTSVASDNSTTTTITAIVVDSANAALAGITVTFSADTGFLSLSSAVTDATGKAVVTFSSGTTNPATRTATITATANGKTTQIPIVIAGASVTVTSTTLSLIAGGSPATVTIVAKSGAGAALANQPVTIAASGAGTVTLGATSGTTGAVGTFTTTVTPTVAGSVTLTISAVGVTRTLAYSITGASAAFQITVPSSDPAANAATLGSTVLFTVQAPSPTTSVTFVSTLGNWDASGSGVITKPVVNGTVSANLLSSLSGVANIQVYDAQRQGQVAYTASRTISYTAAAANAYKVTLQSTPSVVAPSSGGNASLATLVATVTDLSNNPVGGASVAFSIVNPTGGGETISPPVILTAGVASSTTTLGQATTTFTAGSLPSGATGVQVRAKVVGTTIATATSPSGSDATIVIGGTAGSVTIGTSTVISDGASSTIYTLPMSVLVADSNGNPVANTVVSLSSWPIAFNVGGNVCAAPAAGGGAGAPGTFYFNEDVNENLIRDPSEITGARSFYPARSDGTRVPSTSYPLANVLTPPNSAAGTLPATVTTNASGVATFSLTYTKSNAAYIVDRIRARTLVQGTQTLGEINFVLPVLASDVSGPGTATCLLGSSPYL